jgi:hypothetical protein
MDYTDFLLKINQKNIILQNQLSKKLPKKSGDKAFEIQTLKKYPFNYYTFV